MSENPETPETRDEPVDLEETANLRENDYKTGNPDLGPRDNSDVDKAMAGFDVPDADLRGGDSSDDPAHHGQED